MNERLANELLKLLDPERLAAFESNPVAYMNDLELSAADKKAILTRKRAVIKYQAHFGGLTNQQIDEISIESPDVEHAHVEIGPEHEYGATDEEGPGGLFMTTSGMREFGPSTNHIGSDGLIAGNIDCSDKKANSLVIVGTGIKASHLTDEASRYLRMADVVLYCVADPATEVAIRRLNDNVDNLYRFYGDGKLRGITYNEMAETIMEELRAGKRVGAAFYGHAGFLVKPAHLAIRQARREGYEAWMCPGPSCVDCLIADLGIDLSWDGCQIYEATHFMVRNKCPDTTAGLILLQIGCVGDSSFSFKGFDGRHYPRLLNRLIEFYPAEHYVVLYEASQFSICAPRVDVVKLSDLHSVKINGITTMYVPPINVAPLNEELLNIFVASQNANDG
ncbi:hypothetical protein LMG31506_04856 [Cupriavidus yeoncheonensis]|uniref:Tetrapyrrole methylase domain-containing protein n=1 Tax=Cupriavidus yeoncheonensis TaxID=1462994 RepID=A0A916IY56_9BURK|nr:SAM-dependent methyltransferase [Cupriavidus yeoncheonensis]CAG2153584.1 hypothetical protein LMG31506_04856 [Cupriavidus yeoncheonensis]